MHYGHGSDISIGETDKIEWSNGPCYNGHNYVETYTEK